MAFADNDFQGDGASTSHTRSPSPDPQHGASSSCSLLALVSGRARCEWLGHGRYEARIANRVSKVGEDRNGERLCRTPEGISQVRRMDIFILTVSHRFPREFVFFFFSPLLLNLHACQFATRDGRRPWMEWSRCVGSCLPFSHSPRPETRMNGRVIAYCRRGMETPVRSPCSRPTSLFYLQLRVAAGWA
jgi:hypothetical protein